jgi:hypothetical protein
VAELKKSFPRHAFGADIDSLESEGKKFAVELGSKQAAAPSAAWKMLMSARPEVVLWVAYSTKNAGLQAKFKSFYTDWPQARQKIPYTLMQEMRIVPELPGFDDLVEKLFFELMDGKLGTVEEMKAFLEPYSPPAPPPPVHVRRARASKKDLKAKARKQAEADEGLQEDGEGSEEAAVADAAVEAMAASPAKAGPDKVKVTAAKAATPAKAAVSAKPVVAAKAAAPAKPAAKPVAAKKAVPAKVVAKPAAKKPAPAKKPVPAKKAAARPVAKKVVAKKVAVKKPPVKKPAAKKPVAKKTASHSAKKAAPPAKAAKKPAKSPGKRH